MNPNMVEFEPDEIRRIERILLPKWMEGGMTPELWDAMTYAEQCDVKEIKRAYIENTNFDRKVKR